MPAKQRAVEGADEAVSQPEFDRQKWEAEVGFRREELRLKRLEERRLWQDLKLRSKEAKKTRWTNPLLLALIGAFLAAVGNMVVTWLNGNQQFKLESLKDESTRISDMIKTGDQKVAINNLQFLVDTGLVSNPETVASIKRFLKEHPDQGPVLPSSTPISQTGSADLKSFVDNGFVPGIDISELTPNKYINFRALKDYGLQFVYIKASDGHKIDSAAELFAKQANDAGLLIGFYHFFDTEVNIDDQLTAFSKILKDYRWDLPPVVDVEGRSSSNKIEDMVKEIDDFCVKIKNQFNSEPILYLGIGQNFQNLSRYRIWIPRYRYGAGVASYQGVRDPGFPKGWSQYAFWQFSTGVYFGGQGPFDFDVFNGSLQQLSQLKSQH